jgi:WD40 repeat protein
MRQIAILPSGCQDNTIGTILHFTNDHIFYSSTLAVYVLNAATFVLEKIISLNHKAITSICISPHDNNLMLVSSMDGHVCLWNVADEEILAKIQLPGGASVLWDPFSKAKCGLISNESYLKMYTW